MSSAGKKRGRLPPRLPSTAQKDSSRSISELKNLLRQTSESTSGSVSSVAPKQKKNKISEPEGSSVPNTSLGKAARKHKPDLARHETPSEDARESIEKSDPLEYGYHENESEEITTTEGQSSQETSEAGSKEFQESEQARKPEEEENGRQIIDSGEEQDDRNTKDDDDEGGKPLISLTQTRRMLGSGIDTLQSVVAKSHLVNKDPESTEKAIEARSEWSGETHSRYDTLERKYGKGGLGVDDVEKLVRILEEDLALAEMIREAIHDEREAAASAWDFMMEIPDL